MMPYDDMMEFIKQFGCIILFGSIFPMAGMICLITNFWLFKIIKLELWYKRRAIPELSIGIGQFEYMVRFLSHLSIVINVAIMFFTSEELRNAIISSPDDEMKVCLGSSDFCTNVPMNNKFFRATVNYTMVLSAIEHLIIFLKTFYQKYVEESNQYQEEDRTNELLKKIHEAKQRIILSTLTKEEKETPTVYDKVNPEAKKNKKKGLKINYMFNHYGVKPLLKD